MSELFDPKVLARMERLDLVARFAVEGYLSGRHASPFRGFSVEFAQHRPYTPGDDTRRIDWKAYGKTERYYLKEYHLETNLTAYVLLDTSRSMAYASGQLRKIEYAKMAAACLAYLVLDQQDRVTILTANDTVTPVFAPTAQMAGFAVACEAMAPIEPGGAGDLPAALHAAAGILGRKGIVVVISDFLADPEQIVKGLEHLRFQGHDVLAIHVLDHAEIAFPFSGPILFEGLESDTKVFADAARIRRDYCDAFERFTARLRSGCIAVQADYLLADTSEPIDRVLAAYLLARGKRR